jgi:hypothetical protein
MIEHDLSPLIVWVFAGIVGLHGLIHLLGAAKGLGWAEVSSLEATISPGAGVAWLAAAVLMMVTTVAYLSNAHWWWIPGVVALAVSQTLIVMSWQAAWAGTTINVLLLIGCVLAYGSWQFQSMVQGELASLTKDATEVRVSEEDLADLPEPVQRWLQTSGALDKPASETTSLSQTGRLKTEPGGNWMPVRANQTVSVQPPAFLWTASVEAVPQIHLAGRDKFIDGHGEMLIKLLSLVPVAHSTGNEIDQGALVRYLSEMVWYPRAATQDYIEWEEVDDHHAEATMQYKGVEGTGVFTFADGRPVRFEADRFYDRPNGATKERWVVEMSKHKELGGLMVPTKAAVTWKLDPDFTWYELQISSLK